jgi:hypothetical protein
MVQTRPSVSFAQSDGKAFIWIQFCTGDGSATLVEEPEHLSKTE